MSPLTPKELALCLFSLRFLQGELPMNRVGADDLVSPEHFADLPVDEQFISWEEIDALCEKLNLDARPPTGP